MAYSSCRNDLGHSTRGYCVLNLYHWEWADLLILKRSLIMETSIRKERHKQFLIESYPHLWQLENAIEAVLNKGSEELQISVLGKVSEDCASEDSQVLKSRKALKEYWKESLGEASDFGLFCNPEFGTLFIAGALVSQFLHDLDGKPLGEMSSGPYGVLRGLGISKEAANNYIKALKESYYLLLLRGYIPELKKIALLLRRPENKA